MHIVIMAGGSGTRFWPRSRKHAPKQFLTIAGDRPMLRQAVDNSLGEQADLDKLWIVAGQNHAEAVRKILPDLPSAQLLLEPVGRNTAPAIALACLAIAQKDPKAVLAVLPSDHVIRKTKIFRRALAAAEHIALQDYIVTIGLKVSRPETGFGYIKTSEVIETHDDFIVNRVSRFVEKPDLSTAEKYQQSGDYLWNGGMFVFRVDVMLQAMQQLMPELAARFDDLKQALDDDDGAEKLAEIYPQLPSQSIDYGVMEKFAKVAVVPVDMGWSDVGSWAALPEVLQADEGGNIVQGQALLVDSHNSIIDSRSKRTVVALGCQDLVIVDTDDALLVMPKERAQEVRKVLDELKNQNRQELL